LCTILPSPWSITQTRATYGGLCGMPACGQAVGCGVCDTPELWCGAAGLCARVRACAGAAESLHTYIYCIYIRDYHLLHPPAQFWGIFEVVGGVFVIFLGASYKGSDFRWVEVSEKKSAPRHGKGVVLLHILVQYLPPSPPLGLTRNKQDRRDRHNLRLSCYPLSG